MISVILDKFLDKKETKFLINCFKKNKDKTFIFGNTEALNISLQDKNFEPLINKLNISSKKINNSYVDWLQIIKWKVSDGQKLHFDTASDQTTLSSILYLNDNFKGGETYFKDGSFFAPINGRMLYFDGNYFKHGVKPITKGTRYTLAAWYKK
tara:strand:- start:2605 stop:3063 length:459 start_codon:yes stop_codon:yes gene_type:complete